MTTMPLRTNSQRYEALGIANSRRKRRAYRKAIWRDAPQHEAIADFLDLLESPPEWAETWKVWDALLALPGFGVVKATQVVREVGMSHVKTLAGLSPRQRHELGRILTRRNERPAARVKRDHGTKKKVPCSCGAMMTAGSRQCRSCSNRERASAHAPKLVCPECGGRKYPQSKRCTACWDVSPLNPFAAKRRS